MGIKEYIEKLNDKKMQMKQIVETCRNENRPMSAEEVEKFDTLEGECKNLSQTIDRMRDADSMEIEQVAPVVNTVETPENRDVKEFAAYVRQTADKLPVQANIERGNNGGIIPVTIVNKIIDRAKEISPIFNDVQKYNVKGSLYIPYVAAADDNITAAYANEFTDLTATKADLSVVQLSNYLVGLQVNASKSLINNTDLNLTDFIIEKMAKAVAAFFEKETLIGTEGKATGLSTIEDGQIVTSGTSGQIKFDDIIELMAKVYSQYQQNAYFVMNGDTLTTLRKLKDGANRYILNNDVSSPFGYTLLGKTVYVSDQMPKVAGNNVAVYYGDFSEGLAANITEGFEIQVLTEKYATQHAIGFVGWTEFDEKIQNQQAVAALKIKA